MGVMSSSVYSPRDHVRRACRFPGDMMGEASLKDRTELSALREDWSGFNWECG